MPLSLIEQAIVDTLCYAPDDAPKNIAVALSGGLDSIVLLHALAQCVQTQTKLSHVQCYALHIHHGLSVHADEWLEFCRTQASKHDFIFVGHHVQLVNIAHQGIEQAARQARYQALQDLCSQNDIAALLAAHHQDDQAETLLLQLIRGAGVAGLAGMPIKILLANQRTKLIRPFLSLSRQQLSDYAQQHHLTYIEDESNQEQRYARNAIRHDVLPKLEKIRTGCRATLARSAALLAEAKIVLDEIAQVDLQVHQDIAATVPDKLIVHHLRQLSLPRVRNVLRYWLCAKGLRAPSYARLAEMIKQFLHRDEHAHATVHHDDRALSLWREQIWLEPQCNIRVTHDQKKIWRGEEFFDLPEWGGQLWFMPATLGEAGFSRAALLNKALRISSRLGGERFRAHPNKQSCNLKDAYQQRDIPPWLRHGPLLYLDEQLIWVAYLGQHYKKYESLETNDSTTKIKLIWQSHKLAGTAHVFS